MSVPKSMLYQIAPIYKSYKANLKVVALGLIFLLVPSIVWYLIVSSFQGVEFTLLLLFVNFFFSAVILLYFIGFYYPLLLRTYGTQTFYSTPYELIRVNKLFGFKFTKSWKREDINAIRKIMRVQQEQSTRGSDTRITMYTQLVVEDKEGKQSLLLKAEDYILNELLNELKHDGFPTKGILSQLFDEARGFFKKIVEEGNREDLK